MKTMTESEYRAGNFNSDGICLNCGNLQGCVEPDAENYTCDNCGEAQVFGLEQALLIGELEILEDEKPAGINTGKFTW